jgi:hypothetical protein
MHEHPPGVAVFLTETIRDLTVPDGKTDRFGEVLMRNACVCFSL